MNYIPIMQDGKVVQLTMEQYNERVAKQRQKLNIDETTGKLKSYEHEDLDIVKINGQEFKGIGYQGLMTVNTKTYVTEPGRSNDGSIENINDYDTFVVPRCKVNFKYFSLDDYMRLCDAVQPNEFIVEYYDKQFNERVSHLMYCEPEEMAKLYNVGTSVIGVLDYEISFIGTLNTKEDTIKKVQYNANGGTIRNLQGNYDSSTTYNLGQRVLWNSNYYEAIYDRTSFNAENTADVNSDLSNSNIDHSDYWQGVTPTLWSDTATYELGDFVYRTYQENNETKYKYYEAIRGGFSGYLPTNTIYWKSVRCLSYSNKQTYNKGDYTYTGDGNAIPTSQFYKSIFEETTFSGKSPDELGYWKMLPILQPQEIEWGRSIILADQDDLFEPYGIFDLETTYHLGDMVSDNNANAPKYYKALQNEFNKIPLTNSTYWQLLPSQPTSADKWQINDTKNYYVANQPTNVFRDMTLYAQWVFEPEG